MGKFKKAMKAIGSGLVTVAAVVDDIQAPENWYQKATEEARAGNFVAAERYAQYGMDAGRRHTRAQY